ncbi:MAG: LysM peptidoglycan-binding domain-containing protein [Chloroflexi bacterium]|nr:LysM peptidoglycan-binding domain-containing protein [Chloroflexota bacterium]
MKDRSQLTLLIIFEVSACALLCAIISVVGFYATLAPESFFSTPTISVTNTQPPPKVVVASPTTSATAGRTPTPSHFNYKVVAGDTLWGIAAKFNITLEAIITANPGINPDKLLVGQTLIIPATERVAESTPSPDQTVSFVAPEVAALRLRRGPSEAETVIMMLTPLTPLKIVGRTRDSLWLEVIAPNGQKGWVSAQWVRTQLNIAFVPETGQTRVVTATSVTPPTAVALATAPPPQSSEKYPFISGVSDTSRQIFLSGRGLGNRADVFSKVGDSITVSGAFLNGFGIKQYNLRSYQQDLSPVVNYYLQDIARDSNSFANTSLAAEVGWSAHSSTTPGNGDKTLCAPTESPLVCEYRYVRPSVALIMFGTNDVTGMATGNFERNLRQVIEITIQRGIIPVISTIPPMTGRPDGARVPVFNTIIKALAREYDIPLWDYWAALQPLPSYGLTLDDKLFSTR